MFDDIDWAEILKSFRINTTKLILNMIMILLVIGFATLFINIVSALTGRVIKRNQKKGNDPKAKTIITSMTLLHSAVRYSTYFVALAVIINHLGYGSIFSNLVTAAGVGALVISLGAQSVISDVISGGFILFEKQYGVGDFVQINEYSGTVISLAMRCTYLQTWKGEKVIIPHGQIKTVINYSGKFNMAVVDVPTPYEEDSERLIGILKDVADKYYEANKTICYDKPNVMAINSFDESAVTMSIYLKAKGRNHFAVQRGLKLAIKKRFDEEGISIPYNQIVVHNEGSAD
jgi:small conductance mechanosensitive channel